MFGTCFGTRKASKTASDPLPHAVLTLEGDAHGAQPKVTGTGLAVLNSVGVPGGVHQHAELLAGLAAQSRVFKAALEAFRDEALLSGSHQQSMVIDAAGHCPDAWPPKLSCSIRIRAAPETPPPSLLKPADSSSGAHAPVGDQHRAILILEHIQFGKDSLSPAPSKSVFFDTKSSRGQHKSYSSSESLFNGHHSGSPSKSQHGFEGWWHSGREQGAPAGSPAQQQQQQYQHQNCQVEVKQQQQQQQQQEQQLQSQEQHRQLQRGLRAGLIINEAPILATLFDGDGLVLEQNHRSREFYGALDKGGMWSKPAGPKAAGKNLSFFHAEGSLHGTLLELFAVDDAKTLACLLQHIDDKMAWHGTIRVKPRLAAAVIEEAEEALAPAIGNEDKADTEVLDSSQVADQSCVGNSSFVGNSVVNSNPSASFSADVTSAQAADTHNGAEGSLEMRRKGASFDIPRQLPGSFTPRAPSPPLRASFDSNIQKPRNLPRASPSFSNRLQSQLHKRAQQPPQTRTPLGRRSLEPSRSFSRARQQLIPHPGCDAHLQTQPRPVSDDPGGAQVRTHPGRPWPVSAGEVLVGSTWFGRTQEQEARAESQLQGGSNGGQLLGEVTEKPHLEESRLDGKQAAWFGLSHQQQQQQETAAVSELQRGIAEKRQQLGEVTERPQSEEESRLDGEQQQAAWFGLSQQQQQQQAAAVSELQRGIAEKGQQLGDVTEKLQLEVEPGPDEHQQLGGVTAMLQMKEELRSDENQQQLVGSGSKQQSELELPVPPLGQTSKQPGHLMVVEEGIPACMQVNPASASANCTTAGNAGAQTESGVHAGDGPSRFKQGAQKEQEGGVQKDKEGQLPHQQSTQDVVEQPSTFWQGVGKRKGRVSQLQKAAALQGFMHSISSRSLAARTAQLSGTSGELRQGGGQGSPMECPTSSGRESGGQKGALTGPISNGWESGGRRASLHKQDSVTILGSGSSDQAEPPCYHELELKPARDPLTGQPVFLLLQRDVSQRVEQEQLLSGLTEAQLLMLSQIFPRHVVDALSSDDAITVANISDMAYSHADVTICFLDLVGFTSMSSRSESPEEVLIFLNLIFGRFDKLVDKYQVHKIDTIGDCFFLASGILAPDEDGFWAVDKAHDPVAGAGKMMGLAIEMQRATYDVFMPDGQPVQVRIGIHTGPCVSGLVGLTVPKWSVFGDSVNVAARMEQTALAQTIQISSTTAGLLPQDVGLELTPMGGVPIKGKGVMETCVWKHPPQWKDCTSGLPPLPHSCALLHKRFCTPNFSHRSSAQLPASVFLPKVIQASMKRSESTPGHENPHVLSSQLRGLIVVEEGAGDQRNACLAKPRKRSRTLDSRTLPSPKNFPPPTLVVPPSNADNEGMLSNSVSPAAQSAAAAKNLRSSLTGALPLKRGSTSTLSNQDRGSLHASLLEAELRSWASLHQAFTASLRGNKVEQVQEGEEGGRPTTL